MKDLTHKRICEAKMNIGSLEAIKRREQAKGFDTTHTDARIREWEATIEDLRKQR